MDHKKNSIGGLVGSIGGDGKVKIKNCKVDIKTNLANNKNVNFGGLIGDASECTGELELDNNEVRMQNINFAFQAIDYETLNMIENSLIEYEKKLQYIPQLKNAINEFKEIKKGYPLNVSLLDKVNEFIGNLANYITIFPFIKDLLSNIFK